MFNLYSIEESIASLRQHKTRNILTGFGVAWGIFILVVLLGVGKGFEKGVFRIFSGYAQNSIWIYGGQTSVVNGANREGRNILFNSQLVEQLRMRFSEIQYISPEISLQKSTVASFKDANVLIGLKGIQGGYFNIKLIKLKDGRFFNQHDLASNRPVCIIGSKVKKVLFRDASSVIGEYIEISGSWFQVAGVLAEGSLFNQNEQSSVFIPFESFQASFNQSRDFNTVGILLKDKVDGKSFQKAVKEYLAMQLGFDQNDAKALFMLDLNDQIESFQALFTGITIFVWAIGFCLLLSGIVGVSNMMLVIVKERKKEIGIRKAVGARSGAILSMIMSESVLLTVIAGCCGMLLGMGAIFVGNLFINSIANPGTSIVDSLQINIPMTLGAIGILVISGTLAGLIPAFKAAAIMPAQAISIEQ